MYIDGVNFFSVNSDLQKMEEWGIGPEEPGYGNLRKKEQFLRISWNFPVEIKGIEC